jgi:hypothetical protein
MDGTHEITFVPLSIYPSMSVNLPMYPQNSLGL